MRSPWKISRAIKDVCTHAKAELVSANVTSAQSTARTVDAIGNVIFSDVLIRTEIGSVRIALTGGHIRFEPVGATIDFEQLPEAFSQQIDLGEKAVAYSVSRKLKNQSHDQIQTEAKTSVAPSLKLSGSSKKGMESHLSETISTEVPKGRLLSAQRLPQGGFRLTVELPEAVIGAGKFLSGKIYDGRLFTLERVGTASSKTRIRFQALPKHVQTLGGSDAWSDASPEKTALIKRLTAKLLEADDWIVFDFEW